MKTMRLIVRNTAVAVEYAAAELLKYLQVMADDEQCAAIVNDQQDTEGMLLGLFEDFGLSTEGLDHPDLDDAIDIRVKDSQGRIAGSNPRSVLIGVYRFLESCGCRWMRPGKDGDYVPRRAVDGLSAGIVERASYRHRGMCIEGSVSLENMLDSVEWCPKVGLNTYMLEWENPYEYFNKWYSHPTNPFRKAEPRTLAECLAYKTATAAAIKKRGMTYHDMGHGWTGKALGLPTDLVSPWNLYYPEIPAKVQEKMDRWLAMVDGQRTIRHHSPLNSNLCYGNEEVRERIAADMLAYCKAHPEVDVVHLWLGDSWNVQCECERCKDTTPADFMIMICNRADELMTRAGVDAKIAFISYVDTIWPPQTEKLANEDRFLLLFAPISRTYSEPYDADTEGVELTPYLRNKLPRPRHVKENLGYLKQWFKVFNGDALCFEYHFWRDDYHDPGYIEMARVLSEDIKAMRRLRLNGIIEDQTQRAYFPTGFPMYLYGKTLWDENADFEALAEEYFEGAFGQQGRTCLTYLTTLSKLFDPVYLRGDRGQPVDPQAADRLAQIPAVVAAFRPVIEENTAHENAAIALSWRYLLYHAEIATLLAHALKARAQGKTALAREYWEQTRRFAYAHEDLLQPVFDVHDFARFTGSSFS